MQKQIEKIDFILENCEIVTIDGKYIGEFNISDVEYSINRMTCNSIDETYTANHFSISIHRDANIEENTVFTMGSIGDKRKSFDRLHTFHDITSINVYFNQGWFKELKVKKFYVNWFLHEGDFMNNKYQKTHMNQFGDLFLVIDKDKRINNVFDLVKIEDKKHMDFVWKMYK